MASVIDNGNTRTWKTSTGWIINANRRGLGVVEYTVHKEHDGKFFVCSEEGQTIDAQMGLILCAIANYERSICFGFIKPFPRVMTESVGTCRWVKVVR